jgi:hypothetical protein
MEEIPQRFQGTITLKPDETIDIPCQNGDRSLCFFSGLRKRFKVGGSIDDK